MPEMLLSIMISSKVIHQSSSQFSVGVTRGTVCQRESGSQEKEKLDKQILSFPEMESGKRERKSQDKLSFSVLQSKVLSILQMRSL